MAISVVVVTGGHGNYEGRVDYSYSIPPNERSHLEEEFFVDREFRDEADSSKDKIM